MAASLAARSAAVPKIGPDYSRYIASIQQAEFGAALLPQFEEPHPSRILLEHSKPGERLGELYDRMLHTDGMTAGLWEKRVKAVVGLPWDIVPADESDQGKQVADVVRQALYGIRSLEVNLSHQLESIAKGCAFDEVRWEQKTSGTLAGYWVPVELIDRPMWRFGFKPDGVGGHILCVRTRENMLVPVPPGRILHMAHGTKDSPWGSALLDRVFWAYWLSLHAWKYYGVALEKWAQPTPIGKYPSHGGPQAETLDTESVNTLRAAIRDFQTEYGIVIPEGLDISLLEASRGGSVSYEAFIALLDRAKALVFLGEVDTSGLAQGPGSFAKSRVSNDVRYETIAIDAMELANSLTDNLIRPLVAVNFGPDVPVPEWQFDIEEADDRVLRQAGAMAVANFGLPIAESYFYRLHQVPQPATGERVVVSPDVIGARTTPRAAPTTPTAETPADAASARRWDDVELLP